MIRRNHLAIAIGLAALCHPIAGTTGTHAIADPKRGGIAPDASRENRKPSGVAAGKRAARKSKNKRKR